MKTLHNTKDEKGFNDIIRVLNTYLSKNNEIYNLQILKFTMVFLTRNSESNSFDFDIMQSLID